MSREEFPIEEADGGSDEGSDSHWIHKAIYWFYLVPRVVVVTGIVVIFIVACIVVSVIAGGLFCALPLTVAMVVVIIVLIYEHRREVA